MDHGSCLLGLSGARYVFFFVIFFLSVYFFRYRGANGGKSPTADFTREGRGTCDYYTVWWNDRSRAQVERNPRDLRFALCHNRGNWNLASSSACFGVSTFACASRGGKVPVSIPEHWGTHALLRTRGHKNTWAKCLLAIGTGDRAGGQEMAPGALGCWGRRLGLGWPPIRGAASRFGRRKSAGDVRDDAAVGCWDLGRHTLTRSLGTSICTPHNGAFSAAIPPIRIGIVEGCQHTAVSVGEACPEIRQEDDLMGLPDWCYVHKHARVSRSQCCARQGRHTRL
ncbi:uncharacterized protein CCOS01_16038 [Colletotrichum costaricense]|uniref:Uncharacterized protein n=1 Tax=Colletotrichum costaricense TaxID=1209916 RepID=A0AAI9YGB5_9PEZI|nr:uncharacterized protein CCOS01_16038 [Colletotrichum costaricense]KAK1508037.1 hypothetical protein CCOS01_16038 [Colletotrichum costaricense]